MWKDPRKADEKSAGLKTQEGQTQAQRAVTSLLPQY